MAKYDRPELKRRDQEIWRYAVSHLNYSEREIAERFAMSRSNVARILIRFKNQGRVVHPRSGGVNNGK